MSGLRRPLNSWCLLAALLIGSAGEAMGQDGPKDYPQWRGRNRDGAASGFEKPSAWPDTLTLRWKIDVGEGYATPIVIGNTVYAFTRHNGREGITAVNAVSGETIWRTDYSVAYEPYEGAEDHGYGPKATPLFHAGKLYTLGISGTISAFDASSGALVWQKPAPQIQPDVGTASSPLAAGDVVIIQSDGDRAMTAFDAETGRVKWTVNQEFRYASPIVADWHGSRQIIVAAQHSILGLSAVDGSVLWEHPWKSPYVQAITPIVHRETIIVSGHHRGVMALKPIVRNGQWAAEVIWETQRVSMFLSNPVVAGDTLFGLSHMNSGQFFAVDAATGQVLWLDRPRRATNSAIVKADDQIGRAHV